MMTFHYRKQVLEELNMVGVTPNERTDPAVVRDLLNDLYLYEIRKLRDRLLAGEFPRREYSARVLQLRLKYPLLSLPLSEWLEDEPGANE